MAVLKLEDLKNKVSSNFAPFEVEYGDPDDVQLLEFDHPLMVDNKDRQKFFEMMHKVAYVMNTNNLSDAQLSEVLGVEDAKVASDDPWLFLVQELKAVLKSMARDKRKFNTIAKDLGNEFLLWNGLFDSYVEHFGLFAQQGESRPSQTS